MNPKYEFYEVVRVSRRFSHQRRIAGMEGAVLGKSQDDQGRWVYAVFLYSLRKCWSLLEDDLEPTGRTDSRATFYDGTKIRVIVDPATGEGNVVDDAG